MAAAWRLAPVAAATALAVAFLALDPHPVDLAAHVYRAELFGREPFGLWNGNWYGGHHTPAYSLLFPPLGWLLGPSLAGALSAVAAAALFEALARERFGPRARWGALLFGIGTGALLLSGRMPFALGLAIGLGALVALQRGRPAPAVALGAACSLASPVAALFLALAGAAAAIADRRRDAAAVALAAALPALLLALAFPEGGREPFVLSAFAPLPLFCAGCLLLLPPAERALRVGAVLYLALGVGAFALDNPLGGNAVRLGALLGLPLAAILAPGRLPRPGLALVLAGLAFWQWSPAVRDLANALSDPAAEASFYEPLNRYLRSSARPGERVEVVFTHAHWEAAEVADRLPLARGWERQLDIKRNGLFYEGDLDDRRYADWLRERAIGWVALADADLDYSAEREAELVRREPDYLELRATPGRWRVYAVQGARGLAAPADVRVEQEAPDELTLDFRTPRDALVRVYWTPYWLARGGCVERGPGGFTRVRARRAGPLRVVTSFAPRRVLSRGRRCG